MSDASDHEVRLTPFQIVATQKAIRQRKRALGRSIAAAEANHRAGQKIQHNVHESNIDELNTLSQVYDELEAARKAIQQSIKDRLEREAS